MTTVTQPVMAARTTESGSLPRRVGRYLLCREIARGGMGTVYLARAEGMGGIGRVVALKCVHTHLSEVPGLVDMFLDEARVASRIVHPNVCTVLDFGEADGIYYLAMDYLAGEPLSRIGRAALEGQELGDGRFPAVVARILADAAEGLHAAHELVDTAGRPLEVVHRDVSPDNVFVTYDGAVRVLDFGIAAARDKLYETATGELKGTVAYMAPEQLGGGTVDRRADVWGLGVVAWELLTGRALFVRASSAETVDAVTRGPIPPAASVNAAVPEPLSRIVSRALSRDPAGRYATARDMGRALVELPGMAPAGAADVAELLERMFPEGRVAHVQRVAEVASAPVPPATLDAEPSRASVRPAPPVTISEEPGRRPRPRARSPWLVGLITLLLSLAVGLWIGRSLREPPAPVDAAAAP